jgi:hypothetical protein
MTLFSLKPWLSLRVIDDSSHKSWLHRHLCCCSIDAIWLWISPAEPAISPKNIKNRNTQVTCRTENSQKWLWISYATKLWGIVGAQNLCTLFWRREKLFRIRMLTLRIAYRRGDSPSQKQTTIQVESERGLGGLDWALLLNQNACTSGYESFSCVWSKNSRFHLNLIWWMMSPCGLNIDYCLVTVLPSPVNLIWRSYCCGSS